MRAAKPLPSRPPGGTYHPLSRPQAAARARFLDFGSFVMPGPSPDSKIGKSRLRRYAGMVAKRKEPHPVAAAVRNLPAAHLTVFEPMTYAERERLFVALFEHSRAGIRRLCYSYLSSASEVDDLFQEIMTNVWNSLPGFRGEAQLNTW